MQDFSAPAVCFCNSAVAWGGGEKWHLEAALAMAARGRRTILLCRSDSELYRRALQFAPAGTPSLPPAGNEGALTVIAADIGRFSFLNPLLRLRLVSFFRSAGVGAVVMNLPQDLKAVGPAAKAAGTEHIIYRRGSALPVKNSALNRRLYGQVITRLIVNSEATRDLVLVNNSDLIPQERITLLPNGVDIEAFDKALAAPSLVLKEKSIEARLHDWKLPGPSGGAPLILGNAGRLNRQKGQHLFLKLGSTLLAQGFDVRLVLAGTGTREKELKDLAAELGIQEKVLFTGFMEDLAPFWRCIDIFVLTSLWEGFGYVLVEAMLAEKPVSAFRVSNIPDLIREGENGFLFPLPEEERGNSPPDPKSEGGLHPPPSTAEVLDRMAACIAPLASDSGLRKRLGAAGRQFAIERCSQKKQMDTLFSLLLAKTDAEKKAQTAHKKI